MKLSEAAHSLKFTWEISAGHVLQLGIGVVGLCAAYFTAVDQIVDNANRLTGHEIGMDKMELQMSTNLRDVETRIQQNVLEIKQDVRWLVRSQVNTNAEVAPE